MRFGGSARFGPDSRRVQPCHKPIQSLDARHPAAAVADGFEPDARDAGITPPVQCAYVQWSTRRVAVPPGDIDKEQQRFTQEPILQLVGLTVRGWMLHGDVVLRSDTRWCASIRYETLTLRRISGVSISCYQLPVWNCRQDDGADSGLSVKKSGLFVDFHFRTKPM
jgi:hypothetical protein